MPHSKPHDRVVDMALIRVKRGLPFGKPKDHNSQSIDQRNNNYTCSGADRRIKLIGRHCGQVVIGVDEMNG